MDVAITSEHRFSRTPDGAVWTETAHAYHFWSRYCSVFDRVKVIARVREIEAPPPDSKRADGKNVSFASIPYFLGPREYLRKRSSIRRALHSSVGAEEAVILRVSSHLAGSLQPFLRRLGRPYGVEVITDPWDIFSPQANHHPLRPFFRRLFRGQLRSQCRHAACAAYVTEKALQRRYPCPAYEMGVSDVELRPADIYAQPRLYDSGGTSKPLTLITVATQGALYKGNDLMIKAAASCVRRGMDVRLRLIGDGCFRKDLERLASSEGIAERTTFVGQLPSGPAIFEELDRADLFALPSRQEGLPRAMIEAMARALPCIGSDVGGIPELIASEDIVPRNNLDALTDKICDVLGRPDRMSEMSRRNLIRARDFDEHTLHPRREEFYRYLAEVTERWRAANGPAMSLAEQRVPSHL